MDGRCSKQRRGRERDGTKGPEENRQRARERGRERTHALSKCATLCESLATLALSCYHHPFRPSAPQPSTHPRASPLHKLPDFLLSFFFHSRSVFFSFFFLLLLFVVPSASCAANTKYRVSRVLSDHRQVDNLFGSRPPRNLPPLYMACSCSPSLFVVPHCWLDQCGTIGTWTRNLRNTSRFENFGRSGYDLIFASKCRFKIFTRPR